MMDEWHKGFPKQQGWYDCLVDGEEARRRYKHCDINRTDRWIRPDGEYECLTAKVMWTGEASASVW